MHYTIRPGRQPAWRSDTWKKSDILGVYICFSVKISGILEPPQIQRLFISRNGSPLLHASCSVVTYQMTAKHYF